MARKDTLVLDSILLQKEAGFLDVLRPPEIPRFFAPPAGVPLGVSRKEKLRVTQRREKEMWERWNEGGRKSEDLHPLHQSYKPVISQQVRKYADRGKYPIPTSAIQHEMDKQFVRAVKTYNPSRGTQLNTWVNRNLLKAGRFIKNYQNIGHIPEGQISLIPNYDRARAELLDQFGHEPDTKSIAVRMGQPLRKVKQLEKERRDDLATSGFMQDPSDFLAPKELEAFKLIEYDLTPEEKTVYEFTFGVNGRPMLKPGEIAKKAKIHPSKISRIRKKLQEKVHEAMELI
jgi:DNA-directed RNA polymerase specialized sigma subunit